MRVLDGNKERRWWGLCPACGKQFGCPCESCQAHRPEEKPVAIIHELDGGISLEQCPHCGFTETLEWWDHLAMQICNAHDKYVAYALK